MNRTTERVNPVLSMAEARSGVLDRGGIATSMEDTRKMLRDGYGVEDHGLENLVSKLGDFLPPDWFQRYKDGKADDVRTAAYPHFLGKNRRFLREARCKNDIDGTKVLDSVLWLMTGNKLLEEGATTMDKDRNEIGIEIGVGGGMHTNGPLEVVRGEEVELGGSRPVSGLPWIDGEILEGERQWFGRELERDRAETWRKVVIKLRSLLHITSAGKDCVPAVVSWFVVLGRNTQSEKEVMMCRQEVMRDVQEMRKTGVQDVDKDTGWLSDYYLKSVIDGRIPMDNPKTLSLQTSQINKLDFNATYSEQLDEIDRSVRETGGFMVEDKGWVEGKPVFAIRNSKSLPGRVVFANPINGYFTKDGLWNDSAHPEEYRPIPKVGDSYDLIGAHFALLVDYDKDRCLILDPQTGMLLEVERKEFDRRLNSTPKEILIRDGIEVKT